MILVGRVTPHAVFYVELMNTAFEHSYQFVTFKRFRQLKDF